MKTFKCLLALTLAAVLLLSFAACSGGKTETETTTKPEETVTALPTGNFVFTKENYPQMGGSLAAKPLAPALPRPVQTAGRAKKR